MSNLITDAEISMNDDIGKLIIASGAHIGCRKVSSQMSSYIYGRRPDGINIFDINKMWKKLILAARACAAVKNPEFLVSISGKIFGRKPTLKFAEAVNGKGYTGRFIPGTFTNTNIKNSIEPSLIVVSDPAVDKQAIIEASKSNCPVIAFCNADADLSYVDIAIPINNRSPYAIGTGFFLLSRLINYIKLGKSITDNFKEVELFFFRDSSEIEAMMNEQNKEKTVFDFEETIKDDDCNAADFGQEEPIHAGIDESLGWE